MSWLVLDLIVVIVEHPELLALVAIVPAYLPWSLKHRFPGAKRLLFSLASDILLAVTFWHAGFPVLLPECHC